ncbi:MAG: GSCFA domain-containing protein [Chitinophagaceae bacterium]|nr:GSCFA domain-containing protein [Chitinophagaceae bacterium]
MNFMTAIDLKTLPNPITYADKILLVGSCFTEHIGNALKAAKFDILQNPHGILFDPASVTKSLISYAENRNYTAESLFELNGVWHSWDHHSRFSDTDRSSALQKINESQQQASNFIRKVTWLIVTLGSSFSYRRSEASDPTSAGVANCHRAPGNRFNKHMLTIEETTAMLEDCHNRLMEVNPNLNVIFTVSPVRHLRDGVVENNRSKARLLESVHHMVDKSEKIFYFPAYELVIDVLRDYRFYDIDLAHPNYMATEFVLEKFAANCIDDTSRHVMQEVKHLRIAKNHRALHPNSTAHRQFMMQQLENVKALGAKYSFLDLDDELAYFSRT